VRRERSLNGRICQFRAGQSAGKAHPGASPAGEAWRLSPSLRFVPICTLGTQTGRPRRCPRAQPRDAAGVDKAAVLRYQLQLAAEELLGSYGLPVLVYEPPVQARDEAVQCKRHVDALLRDACPAAVDVIETPSSLLAPSVAAQRVLCPVLSGPSRQHAQAKPAVSAALQVKPVFKLTA